MRVVNGFGRAIENDAREGLASFAGRRGSLLLTTSLQVSLRWRARLPRDRFLLHHFGTARQIVRRVHYDIGHKYRRDNNNE